jgi:hypothetical protein
MSNKYRYERKFYFPNGNKHTLGSIILTSPIGFKEIYYERIINSIYYDTGNLENYWDNEEGQSIRRKLRVRWYGEESTPTKDAMVELKCKNGMAGYKIREPFYDIKDNFIKELLSKTTPLILVRYKRRYFSTYDEKFRITIDSSITYQGLLPETKKVIPFQENGCVIELKYGNEYDEYAAEIMEKFNIRVTKFSKYARAIKACYAN